MAFVFAWTWGIGGRALAERCATDFVMPTGFLWLAMLTGAITFWKMRRTLAAVICAMVFVFLLTFFNSMIAGVFYRTTELELSENPMLQVTEPLDAVVLLGGYAVRNQFGEAQVNADGERLVTVAKLWYSGKTRTIICTGTAHMGDSHPSVLGRELLVSLGVPDEIIFEIPGENTSQEMQSMKTFLGDPPATWLKHVGSTDEAATTESQDSSRRLGLVTSSYHIKRALRLAETQGIEFTPIPCGFSSSDNDWTPRQLIPNASAGSKMASVCKTFLASLVGR